jgi:hypothetical protein
MCPTTNGTPPTVYHCNSEESWNFSHWAWGDIDVLAGDIVGLVSARDLREFDALSFNTGPLYLQGQITILANRPEINNAWRVHPSPVPNPLTPCVLDFQILAN